MIVINPLRDLSFSESLSSDQLASAIESQLANSARASFGDYATSLSSIAATERGGILVTFKDDACKFVRRSDGRYIAETRSVSGRFTEIGAIDTIGTYLTQVAQAMSVVTSLAHIISSADIARRLGTLERNNAALFHYREIDASAKLRRVYEDLRRELDSPQVSSDRILSIRGIFREHRHVLIADANRKIDEMDLLLGAYKNHVRKLVGLAKKRRLKCRSQDIAGVIEMVRIAGYCFQMENLASSYCGVEADQEVLRREAASDLSRLANKLKPLEVEVDDLSPNCTLLLNSAAVWQPSEVGGS